LSTELWLLLSSLPIYALYLGVQSILYRAHYGLWFAQTARDEEGAPSVSLGRAERALRNFNETFLPFAILLVVAHLADRNDPVVFWGAVDWLLCRALYLPLYLFGVFAVRSLVWLIGALGLFAMFFGLLF
jgi:uncharacterized MAPEG superfamily protein